MERIYAGRYPSPEKDSGENMIRRGIRKEYKFFIWGLLFLMGLTFWEGCQRREKDESEPIEEEDFQEKFQEKLFGKAKKKKRYRKEGGRIVFRENPFLTWEEEKELSKTKKRKILDYLTLSAIFYSSKNSFVVIEGHILKEGDMIDEKKIVKIEPEKVILKDEEGEYVVFLKDEE